MNVMLSEAQAGPKLFSILTMTKTGQVFFNWIMVLLRPKGTMNFTLPSESQYCCSLMLKQTPAVLIGPWTDNKLTEDEPKFYKGN